ncbi:MAG: hypothetical protein D6820_09745, partial [Lentisphaerae bacterium]
YVPFAAKHPNLRVAGPFRNLGPFGDWRIIPGTLWIRYYLPDRGKGPLAGVQLPKIWLETPSGQRFCIVPLSIRHVFRRQNIPLTRLDPGKQKFKAHLMGKAIGFSKGFGIFGGAINGLGKNLVGQRQGSRWERQVRQRVRELVRLMEGRGEDQPPPGNLEAAATCCNFIHYLGRTLYCADGHVLVVWGRLPVIPRTYQHADYLAAGDLRYLSFTRYLLCHGGFDLKQTHSLYPLICTGSLADEELVTFSRPGQGEWYVIAWSRSKDRPHNATKENGVTWQEWGPGVVQQLTTRWLTVAPHWQKSGIAPDSKLLPWNRSDWSGSQYDPNLTGNNLRPGVLGDYQPRISYFTREAFEALGDIRRALPLPPGEDW